MARLPIPPPRPLLFPLRPASSARVELTDLPNRSYRVTIDHQPLHGITPDMLFDWFRGLGGTIAYGGEIRPRYLVWHPTDHIHWELARPAPSGGAGEGARFRIVEVFAARPEFYVDTTETVEKLDRTGIRLVHRIAGVPVIRLEHTWSKGRDRTHYVSVLDVGARARLFAPVNSFLTTRRFPEEMARAWAVHNIEEVGLLEHLIPLLQTQPPQPALRPAAATAAATLAPAT